VSQSPVWLAPLYYEEYTDLSPGGLGIEEMEEIGGSANVVRMPAKDALIINTHDLGYNLSKYVTSSYLHVLACALACAQAFLALSVRGSKLGAVCTMDSVPGGAQAERNETSHADICTKPGFVTSPRTGK
jgi:hypothetical protein